MILTKAEAAACLHTANTIPGFVDIFVGPRNITFMEGGIVLVYDERTGDTERFADRATFAKRYEVAS